MRPVITTTATVGGIALAGFSWGVCEATLFTVREVSAPVLPPGGDPLRVLHISDIHLVPRQALKLRFLRSLWELEPDLVVNTGDNLSSKDAVGPLARSLVRLTKKPGAFVFGSNDYTAPAMRNPLRYFAGPSSKSSDGIFRPNLPWQELRDRLSEHGWLNLNNSHGTLTVKDYRIALRGVDDPHIGRDNYASGPADQSADLRLGVMHAPYRRILDAMTLDGVDLMFAGHTHGGQVCVPGYGALVTNCDLDAKRVKGLSQHRVGDATAWLHVSAGMGTSPYAPFRFACRPEVTLLTLTARDQ